MLSDWSVDDWRQIKDDFCRPRRCAEGGSAGAASSSPTAPPRRLHSRPGPARGCGSGSATPPTARLTNVGIDGAKTLIVAVDGQPSEPFEPLRNQFPMGPGARFELMFDMPREAGAEVRLVLRGDRASRTCRSSRSPPKASRSPRDLRRSPAGQSAAAGGDRARGRAELRRRRHRRRRRRPSRSTASPSSTGRRSRSVRRRGRADRVRLRQQDRRSSRRCASAATSPGSCIRWTTAGSPTGATPSSSSPAAPLHIAFVADNPGKWPIESAIPEHRAAGVGAWFQVS